MVTLQQNISPILHFDKINTNLYYYSLIHKEVTKVSEMALDFLAEFRKSYTNKISSEFSSKIVAENSA